MKNWVNALDSFKDKKILVIGDVMIDKFTWGKVKRINPEQPAAINVNVNEEKDTYLLGGTANVANNIACLGAGCKLYGAIGKDQYGEKISRMCQEKDISFIGFPHKKRTNMKWRIMAHGQQVTRLNFGEDDLNIGSKIKQELINILEKDIKKYNFIILSDYDKGFFNNKNAKEIINLANSYGVPIHVDPKPQNIDYFKGCTIISPNEQEAEQITGIKYSNGEDTLVKIAKCLAEKINAKYVIITCGEDGVFAYDAKKERSLMVETKAKKVHDVTGAGDTFAAVLPLGLASGLDLFDSVRLANYAAGVVVEKVGTATPTPEQIKKKIQEDNNF